MAFQHQIPMRVLSLLAFTSCIYVPYESSALGMWGDFSWHVSRSRSQDAADGGWVGNDASRSNVNCTEGAKVETRKRRYVTFPEGSSSSLAICLSLGVSDTNLIFTHGLGYGISFDLPNDTKSLKGDSKSKGDEAIRELRSLDLHDNLLAKRRDRRTLYRRIEEALQIFGMDGRACVLRTLCEVAQRIAPKGGLMQEFIRIIFSMPQAGRRRPSWDAWDWDAEESKEYDEAHLQGRDNPDSNCAYQFTGCDVSLLDFLIK